MFHALLLTVLLQSPLPSDLPNTSDWPFHLNSDDVGVYAASIPSIAQAGQLTTMRAYLNRNGICASNEEACEIITTFSYVCDHADLEQQRRSVGSYVIEGNAGKHEAAGYIDIRPHPNNVVFRLFVLRDGSWVELQRDDPEYSDEHKSYMTFWSIGLQKRSGERP